MLNLTLNEVEKLSKDYNIIPLCLEVHADMETPISVFKRFESEKGCFLLESVEGGEKWARYSFIGFNPFLTFKSNQTRCEIIRNNSIEIVEGNPITVIKGIMDQYKGLHLKGLPRFSGGAVGYFGYDLIRQFENLPNAPEDDLGIPESEFMFCDEVLAFDHLKQKLQIIVNLHTDGDLSANYQKTEARIEELYQQIVVVRPDLVDNFRPVLNGKGAKLDIKSNFTKEEFCNIVKKAKEYIVEGDIFQVVLSQRFSLETEQNPFNVYRVLRVLNPSPYMYFLKFDGFSVVGASPELMVRVEDGKVETCPIAGTRKRGATQQEDLRLEKELLADEKELAEHTMLVDLGRNDIGRVSQFGTVRVKDLMHVERYSHVMHIVSTVEGKMRDDKTPFDALMSVLPAGTLSGAPKIRAMEIIDELENKKRLTYGSAIGYLSYDGNLDSCITIRTILFKDKMAFVQAGAGVVADSVPEMEYEETINKAMAMFKSFELVENGTAKN